MQSHVSHHSETTGGKKFSSVGLKDIYKIWGFFRLWYLLLRSEAIHCLQGTCLISLAIGRFETTDQEEILLQKKIGNLLFLCKMG